MDPLEIITALRHKKVVPRLEGDQLKLVGETASLSKDLIEHIKDAKQELISFLKTTMDHLTATPIPAIPRQESYPASNAQRRIWLLSQFEGGTAAYNIVTSLYLKGNVIVENLNRAFQTSVQRHESLRTIFIVPDGEPRQVVLDHISFALTFEDLREQADISNYLKAEVEQLTNWKFDLGKGPLIKVRLFQLSDDEYAMCFGVHHIVSDGWSIGVLVQEVMRSYEAYCKEVHVAADVLPIHYKEYSHWLEQRLAGEYGQQAKAFWKRQFPDVPEPLDLPADFTRQAMKSFEGAVAKFYFDADFYTAILNFCRKHNVTLFNCFRASLNILLHKFSGQQTIVIGTPVSGRNHVDLENQIGLYVNTIPLKAEIEETDTFVAFLRSISENSYKAFEYQDYPLDRVIEDLNIKRDTSRNPLFDVMMVLQNTAIGDGTININKQYGFDLFLLDKYLYPAGRATDENRAAKFDLNFNFDVEPGNQFYLEIEYATRLFKRDTIIRLYEAFIYIITQVLDNPSKAISEIEIVDQQKQHEILHGFNKPVAAVETYSITAMLAPAFAEYAQHTALITDNVRLSYEELDRQSDYVANGLRPLMQDTGNTFIGLLMERSEWMLSGILGILKAGGAYVPVDTKYPAARIAYIIEDARLDCLLVDDIGRTLVPAGYNGKVIHINECGRPIDPFPEQLLTDKDQREETAYLIYTSGSTGKPKGVEICHRNTIAFLQWAGREFADTSFEILYATTSFCFDLSVFEFFFPLLQGKTIRLLDSALNIREYLPKDRHVMINTVPAVVRNLLEEGLDWSHVTALNMAGEQVPKRMKEELDYSRIEVRNLYGPSEDTTYSTIYRFERDDYPAIPIGVPIDDTQLYILDRRQQLLPVGVDGEIYLSGQCIAKGYFNKPALTAERFLENPFLPGMVMYRTGDIGKWLPDGKVIFTGRIDDQVKVRGYRIEPGEIQYLLEQHPRVEEAVVIVSRIDGENQLAAYWVEKEPITAAGLKAYLALHLPAYMVPDHWMKLDSIPLNSNGKVDRKSLPDPATGPIEKGTTVPAVTPLQQQLLGLWKQVLHVDELGITHNFFDVGGHSLKAAKLKALIIRELERELSLNELFRFPTIEQQATLLGSKSKTIAVRIEPVTAHADYPISFSQERLWVLTNFEDASMAYNMPAAFNVKGHLNIALLEQAFKVVIERHEILRTIFTEREHRPVQIILDADDVPFRIETVSIDHTLTKGEEIQLLQDKWRTAFDLAKGPLLSCFILDTPGSKILSFNMHHIISDGWSVGVLYKDVIEVYRQLITGRPVMLSPLTLQYKDFAVWQRNLLSGDLFGESLAFWKGVFNDAPPALELPADYHRPEVKTYRGATYNFTFKPHLANRVSQLAKNTGVSLFMTLMAGVNVLLKKYANQNDIVIGTPVAGRDQQELQDQIGFYVNTLAIRTRIDPAAGFDTLLQQERDIILSAFEYQAFPFEMLVEELQLKRNLSRSPLFDVMVVLQNIEGLAQSDMKYVTPELQFDRMQLSSDIAKYDLTFSFAEETVGLKLSLEYNTDLFKIETITRMVSHLVRLFEQVTVTPEISVRDIVLIDEQEAYTLTAIADQTQISYDHSATIVSLFRNAVNRFPDNIALELAGKSFTYRELDQRSGQLARELITTYVVKPEDLVLLHFDRTEWMLIGILAVLKAGAAYVPVDPTYPAARINYITADSGSHLCLFDVDPGEEIKTQCANKAFVNITELDYTGEPALVYPEPAHPAYVIYTSGTTGNPKGVVIEHRNVSRLLFNDQPLFDFNAADRWSLFHSYCFDFSVWEMYGALLNGGTLVMVPRVTAQNSIDFYDFLMSEKITVLNQTPTAFRSLVQQNQSRFTAGALTVRYLIFGGEALMPEILREWHAMLPACKNINMYGITETTVHVTYKEISAVEIAANKSNIGVPIPTLSCYVLDADLQQVPIGIAGELCVGGAGVARGYLNRPDLTAEKFVDNPVKPGEKLYRSGDYARILPNGDLEYIGRKDDQVKIRGHRIEIAEVEAAITRQEGIKDAIVIAIKDAKGEYDLVAYFIPEETFDQLHLHTMLSRELPAYMKPAYLIALKEFPLNNNGKLDKGALPQPSAAVERKSDYIPSRNDIDREIIAIWESVLEKDGIGIRDNFFDLGGHSLKATRVISKINEVYGIRVDLKNLFIDPTIEHLSNYIETVRWMEDKDTLLAAGKDELIF